MIFAFGEFELDARLCVLRRGSEAIRVQPKVFDTLRYLIEHRDRVVSQAELLDVVWDGKRLSRVAVPWSIRHARRILGQASVDGHPIETVRGRGYRFAAEVSALPRFPAGAEAPAQAARAAFPGAGEPFLGRAAVMGRLADALTDARAGKGGLCLLIGDAGIGKTRCANELATSAWRSGDAVSIGRSAAADGAPAMWPWIQILRNIDEDHDLFGDHRSRVRAALSVLLPGSRVPRVRPGAEPVVPQGSRFWLSEAVAHALRRVGKRRPRVILVEDLHAADEGTIDVLGLLAPDLQSSRLLVIATSRDDAGGRLSRRVRPCDVVLLSGLGLDDVDRYLSEATGHPVSPDLARFVLDRTQGNPLLLKEAARMVLAQRNQPGHARPHEITLPEVARGFLHDRIAGLGPQTRDVLDAASVIGEEFEIGVLKHVVQMPAEPLLSCVDEALRSGIVDRGPGDAFAFAHALLRDALYDDLSAAARARIHRKVATALQARAAVDNRSRAIAYHLHRALPNANPQEVEEYSRLAAADAMRVCAYADAAELYRWAISALGHAGTPDVRATCELFVSAAYAERQAGRIPEAREFCGRAIEIAMQRNFGDLLVKAARILRPTVWLAHVPDGLVLDAIERALEILPPDAGVSRAQAYGLLANLPPHSWSVARSRELSGRALREAREIGDRSLVLEALVRTFPGLAGPDTTSELLAACDEVLRLDGHPPSWWGAEAYVARAHALIQRSDAAGATRALDAFGECAKLLRISEATWQYERLYAQRAIYAGEFTEAEVRFAELFSRSEGFRQYAAFFYVAQMNALSWARSGRPLPAAMLESTLDVEWQWTTKMPAFRAERVMAMIFEGQTSAATAELEELARDHFRLVEQDVGYLYTLSRLAQAAVALGHREAAASLYESLRPYSGYNARNALSLGLGCVAHYIGLLAEFLDRPREARAHFEQAVSINECLGDRVHEQQSRTALAALSGAVLER